MTIEDVKLDLQLNIDDITPEEDLKLRLLAKFLVDKLFDDIHNGKVDNNE
jgi:hypothetical protein